VSVRAECMFVSESECFVECMNYHKSHCVVNTRIMNSCNFTEMINVMTKYQLIHT
jgi:hypothetical protein